MKLVIKPHRPRQRLLLVIGFLMLSAIAVGFAFHYGHWRSIGSAMTDATGKRGIMEDYLGVKKQNKQYVSEVATLQTTVEVDRYARAEHQKTISGLQTQVADLKLELAFYRDIVSSTQPEKGPHVRGFKLRDVGGDGRFQYRLVLTHVNKDDRVSKGRVDVEIRGQDNGTKQHLNLAEVVEPDSGDLGFNFKHFRRIEGVMQLPSNFSPEKVHVAVYEDGQKKSSFKKTYDWVKLIN
ncbi:MAG: hypothetical protein ACI9BW_002792 [Gammaproteobacteria bacterium]|jgi:hypothetical protein